MKCWQYHPKRKIHNEHICRFFILSLSASTSQPETTTAADSNYWKEFYFIIKAVKAACFRTNGADSAGFQYKRLLISPRKNPAAQFTLCKIEPQRGSSGVKIRNIFFLTGHWISTCIHTVKTSTVRYGLASIDLKRFEWEACWCWSHTHTLARRLWKHLVICSR